MLILAQSIYSCVHPPFSWNKKAKTEIGEFPNVASIFSGHTEQDPWRATLKRQVDNMSGFLTLDTAS